MGIGFEKTLSWEDLEENNEQEAATEVKEVENDAAVEKTEETSEENNLK
jgi:hypothetical protein